MGGTKAAPARGLGPEGHPAGIVHQSCSRCLLGSESRLAGERNRAHDQYFGEPAFAQVIKRSQSRNARRFAPSWGPRPGPKNLDVLRHLVRHCARAADAQNTRPMDGARRCRDQHDRVRPARFGPNSRTRLHRDKVFLDYRTLTPRRHGEEERTAARTTSPLHETLRDPGRGAHETFGWERPSGSRSTARRGLQLPAQQCVRVHPRRCSPRRHGSRRPFLI